MSSCCVRIWFFELASDESDHEKWTDINDGLIMPESFDKSTMAIEFSVMRLSGYVTFVTVIQCVIIWPCTQIVILGNYLHDAAWAMLTPTLRARSLIPSTHLYGCLYPSRVDIRKCVVQNVCCKSKGIHVAIALLRKEANSANIFPKVHALLCWVAILIELSSKTLKFISPVIKLVFNVLNFHRLDTKLRWFCSFQSLLFLTCDCS